MMVGIRQSQDFRKYLQEMHSCRIGGSDRRAQGECVERVKLTKRHVESRECGEMQAKIRDGRRQSSEGMRRAMFASVDRVSQVEPYVAVQAAECVSRSEVHVLEKDGKGRWPHERG